MEELALLAGLPLFAGIPTADIPPLLGSLSARTQSFCAGELILLAGWEAKEIGVVLEGAIEAERANPAGDALPITRMGPGGVFGDVLAGSHTPSPVTVRALSDCRVLFFSHRLLLSGQNGPAAGRMVQNLVGIISDKYFTLSARLDLLLCRRLRERILLFLRQNNAHKAPVTLPMDRAAMAAWLGCERSALSRELSRMQAEGLLQIKKRQFYLPGQKEGGK